MSLKLLFLPWLVIADQRRQIASLLALLAFANATIAADASGVVARGKRGRFVSVKATD